MIESRVVAGVLSDSRPALWLVGAARAITAVQGCRTTGAAPRGLDPASNGREASPGLSRPGRARRAMPIGARRRARRHQQVSTSRLSHGPSSAGYWNPTAKEKSATSCAAVARGNDHQLRTPSARSPTRRSRRSLSGRSRGFRVRRPKLSAGVLPGLERVEERVERAVVPAPEL